MQYCGMKRDQNYKTIKIFPRTDASDWVVAITTELGKYRKMIQQMMGGDLDQETKEYVSSRVSTMQPSIQRHWLLNSVDSFTEGRLVCNTIDPTITKVTINPSTLI